MTFWNPCNRSGTMNVLAMKGLGGAREIVQLWMIGKLEYAILVVDQYSSYTIKLCLTTDNCATLCMILKKWGKLGKNWDFSFIETVVNILTKPNKVQDLIDLSLNNKEVYNIVQAIYIQDTFLFTYNICKEAKVDKDYPNLGYNINNFKARIEVVVEFQVNSRNFKGS